MSGLTGSKKKTSGTDTGAKVAGFLFGAGVWIVGVWVGVFDGLPVLTNDFKSKTSLIIIKANCLRRPSNRASLSAQFSL